MKEIPLRFFSENDAISIGEKLLGKYIFTNLDNNLTGGKIVETEAYLGINDKASHAYNNKRTSRTEAMYAKGGCCYVYLCYGIHFLFNIVTDLKDRPSAVLIRAIEPIAGLDIMLNRRKFSKISHDLTNGPGKLTQALGITDHFNGKVLKREKIWLEDHNVWIDQKNIFSSPRIGVDYAEEDAKLPYRFYINGNKWVSMRNTSKN